MDSVNGIRVHNTGIFVMAFAINAPGVSGADPGFADDGSSPTFAIGQSETIRPSGLYAYRDLEAHKQMWPVADIAGGPNAHEASENCIYDPTANVVAVYDCGGTTGSPSFSYRGVSSD